MDGSRDENLRKTNQVDGGQHRKPTSTNPVDFLKYEAGKKQIARTAKSHDEYQTLVRELARKLGI